MATSPSSFPQASASGQGQGSGSSFSPSSMVGSSGSGSDAGGDSQSPTGSPTASLSQVTGQIREMESSLLSLSSQFPVAAGDIRRAIEGIRTVLQRIVSSPGAGEPAAPRG